MRAIVSTVFLLALTGAGHAAEADACGTLVDRIVAEAPARADEQRRDYARFTAGPDTTLTLACGAPDLSSVGAQYRGESPPDAYYTVFGKAGHAVTGIDAGVLEAAAHTAREAAARLRHSNVDAGGARVTCSVSKSDQGPLTMCAVIEHGDRS